MEQKRIKRAPRALLDSMEQMVRLIRSQGVGEALLTSTVRSIGRQIGRELIRGLMGSLPGRR